jgi:hypothetical protein
MIVFWALAIAFRTAARVLPLYPDIDPFALQIEMRLRDLPRAFDAKQSSEKFGITHVVQLRRTPIILSLTHSKSRRP